MKLTVNILASVFVLASVPAFAVRYWRGTEEGALFSTPANWFRDDARTQVADSMPDTSKGKTYWLDYNNGLTVFNVAAAVNDNVDIGTASEQAFIWRATDPSCGLSASGKSFHLGHDAGKSPTYLQIDGGTYSFKNTYVGYVADVRAGLTFNGESFTAGGDVVLGNGANATASLIVNGGSFATGSNNVTRIGYADGVKAELTVDGGTFVTGKARVGGGVSGVDGTLTIKSGEFRTIKTGSDDNSTVFMVCDQANTRGTIVIDGGTLDTTSSYSAQIGGMDEIEANIYVNTGGVWNASGFYLGGKAAKTKYSVTNSVTRLHVNGGTVNLSGASGIGYAVGEGSSAEMVLNDGVVTMSGADVFYVGESGPGSFTMNGGVFTMVEQSTGFGFGHKKNGSDVGIVTLNGGVLNIYRFRLDYVQPGSKLIFNGGTVKPTKSKEDFLNANTNLECVIDEGGLIVDTAGFDITIAHPFVAAAGKTIGGITKKGSGVLTLTEPFDGAITVLRGSVVTNLVTVVTDPETGEVTTSTNAFTISATPPAATDRYWIAKTAEGLASDSANWSTTSGGASGASVPDWNCLYGTICFNKAYANRVTVFDKAIEPVKVDYLKVGCNTEVPLVWRATLPYCGFSYISGQWRLAYDDGHTNANLTVESGTYACDDYFYVGYTTGGHAEFVMKGGNVTVGKPRVAGKKDNLVGTVTISNGTFTVTDSLHISAGAATGVTGKLIVDGGALVTTAPDYVRIGQNSKQSTALLQMKSGTWKTKSFLVGGTYKKEANSFPGMMASLIVDGGTVTASGDCSIGANIADDARSEMIVNGGSVNLNSSSFYVGDGGPGYLTINGGSLTMKDSDYGLSFGHYQSDGTGVDSGCVTLNGGTLTIPKFRLDYIAPGSKLVFNGGTIKATRDQPDFLAVTDSLTCEMQEDGIVFDTAGFNVTNAHDIVRADGVTKTKIVKKGDGELTFAGAIDPYGGYISVEEGKLTFLNLSCARVRQISVSDGAELDINGAEVVTKEYWLNGERQPSGIYRGAHNGTICVWTSGLNMILK